MRNLKIFEDPRRARRKLAALAISGLAAVGVGAALLGTASAATTLVVDDDLACPGATYTTINAAEGAAGPGDIIEVCAGTYNPSPGVDIDKGLSIRGPNYGISPNGGSRVAEAVITGPGPALRISTTAPVEIDGFTFSGGTGAPIDSYTADNSPTIAHNIFTAEDDGFYFNMPASITFTDNYLHDLADCGGCDGLFIAGDWNGSSGTVASITDNVWEDVGSSGMNLSNVSGTVSGNSFSYVTYYGALLANGTNVDVTDNTFDHTINPDLTVRTWGAGVRFYTPSAGFGATITDNTFDQNYVGIGVRKGSPTADLTGLDVHAHQNNFVGNTAAGIRHDGLGPFDAECNWWNSTSGPTNTGNPGGTGDVVDGEAGSGPVDFTPWLTAPAPGGPCPVPPPNKDACKKGGWMSYTDDQGRPFKNQGDCVSYVSTKGKNKAAG